MGWLGRCGSDSSCFSHARKACRMNVAHTFEITDEETKAGTRGSSGLCFCAVLLRSVQVELDDLDGIGRQGHGEIAACVVQRGLNRDDPFGIINGVGGLGVGRADANELRISCWVRTRQRQCQRLGIR